MNRSSFLIAIIIGLLIIPLANQHISASVFSNLINQPGLSPHISGYVYEDSNQNMIFDHDDRPIQDVLVTNGKTITKTDELGNYHLPLENASFVYITKPGDLNLPIKQGSIPQFYKRITTESTGYDFPLIPTGQKDAWTTVLMNDIHIAGNISESQVANDPKWEANQHPKETFDEYVQEFSTIHPQPDFFISIGDMIARGELHSIETCESWYQLYIDSLASIQKPIFNVFGNHEAVGLYNETVSPSHPFHGKGMYHHFFGPTYYSFDYGPYHFICLDANIITTENGSVRHIDGIDDNQWQWLEQDLTFHQDSCKIICYHQPIDDTLGYWKVNKNETLLLFKDHNVSLCVAGHAHANGLYTQDGITFVTNGAISGAWWGPTMNWLMYPFHPEYKTQNLNANPDGTPQGYRLLSIHQNGYTSSYKPFRESRNISLTFPSQTRIWSGNPLTRLCYLYRDGYFFTDGKNGYSFQSILDEQKNSIEPKRNNGFFVRNIDQVQINAWSLYPIQSVQLRIDNKDWQMMTHDHGLQWSISLDDNLLGFGFHRISIFMMDAQGSIEKDFLCFGL